MIKGAKEKAALVTMGKVLSVCLFLFCFLQWEKMKFKVEPAKRTTFNISNHKATKDAVGVGHQTLLTNLALKTFVREKVCKMPSFTLYERVSTF